MRDHHVFTTYSGRRHHHSYDLFSLYTPTLCPHLEGPFLHPAFQAFLSFQHCRPRSPFEPECVNMSTSNHGRRELARGKGVQCLRRSSSRALPETTPRRLLIRLHCAPNNIFFHVFVALFSSCLHCVGRASRALRSLFSLHPSFSLSLKTGTHSSLPFLYACVCSLSSCVLHGLAYD
jgi:hypothetical protein